MTLRARSAFDTLIRGARVFDGTGRQPFTADVGIRGDRIAAIGTLDPASADRTIDARGRALCPGFIDVHSHAEMTLVKPDHPRILEPLVRQGITTFVGGNCGTSMAPVFPEKARYVHTFFDFFLGAPQHDHIHWQTFDQMLSHVESQGALLNAGFLAPHGILRLNVMGDRNETAGAQDIAAMKTMLADCLEAGALGMSTGLMYFPGLSSDEHELLELARVVHDHHRVFTSHLRSYNSDTMGRALDEVMGVCAAAEVPLQVSHLFCIPNLPWPLKTLVDRLLQLGSRVHASVPLPIPIDGLLASQMEKAFRRADAGEPIGFDTMPTSAGFTHLLAFFPPWVLQGSIPEVLKRLRDPVSRREIRRSIEEGDVAWPHRGRDSWSFNAFKVMGYGAAFIMSVTTEKNRPLEGRSFTDIAAEVGKHPFDVVCDLLVEEEGRVLVFETPTFPGDPFTERSVLAALLNPHVSVVTDTILLGFGLPSHLFYDCYPRLLGSYVRDHRHLGLAEAIRKSTSLPADQLGIRDRGRIRPGLFADLVLFDPARIASRSTAQAPSNFPVGIDHVFINGHAIIDPEGFHPDPLPGRVLRAGA